MVPAAGKYAIIPAAMNETYEHWSRLLTAREIGLGWLKTITMLTTQSAMPMHRHAHSTVEIIFCLKGEFRYHIDGFGGVTLGTGDAIVIPARTEHELDRRLEIPGVRLSFFLHRRMQAERRFAVFTAADYGRFHGRIAEAAGTPFKLPPPLFAVVRQLAAVLEKDDGEITSIDFGLLRILCCLILYDTVNVLDRPQKRDVPQCIDAAIGFIEKNYARKFKIDELISHVGYGRARFFELFRARTHLTPVEYLTRYRLAKAGELLVSTTLPVSAVAEAVGIADPVYFAALFKRNTGMSPLRFRTASSRSAGAS